LKTVDYLDITFDLNSATFKPYNKPNNDPRYINAKSNHPPTVVKQIPNSVSKRISTNSSNHEIFNSAAPTYNNILKNCGYKDKIEFIPKNTTKNIRNRRRNIIWYNPPFSQNVKTNVAKQFLKLIRKHFGKNHKYNKIFNRNNVKVSYSCMDNMKKIISAHNKKIINESETVDRACNCRNKNLCPLNGKCLTSNVIYSAEIINENTQESKVYIGICETEFKTRYRNHQKALKNRKYEKDTELSKYVWKLRDEEINFNINWSIIRKARSYSPISKSCNLCLTEKLLLRNYKDKHKLLNKRSEMISKCRHENKYILKNN